MIHIYVIDHMLNLISYKTTRFSFFLKNIINIVELYKMETNSIILIRGRRDKNDRVSVMGGQLEVNTYMNIMLAFINTTMDMSKVAWVNGWLIFSTNLHIKIIFQIIKILLLILNFIRWKQIVLYLFMDIETKMIE
jgi:hypothetical protein